MKKLINLSLYLLVLIVCISGCGSSKYMPSNEKISINPILYYNFDGDASGTTVTDDSGNNNTGTLYGAATLSTDQARSGKALALAGNQPYLALPSTFTLPEEFTISIWVYPTAWTSWARVLDFSSSTTTSNLFLTLRDGDNHISCSITDSTTASTCVYCDNANSSTVPLNTWTQIVVTAKASEAELYINGTSVASKKPFIAPSALGTLDHSYLGKSKYSADAYFPGYIDNFRIFNQALTADQVRNLYYNY